MNNPLNKTYIKLFKNYFEVDYYKMFLKNEKHKIDKGIAVKSDVNSKIKNLFDRELIGSARGFLDSDNYD